MSRMYRHLRDPYVESECERAGCDPFGPCPHHPHITEPSSRATYDAGRSPYWAFLFDGREAETRTETEGPS